MWSEEQSPVTAPDSRSFSHFVAAFFGSALKLDLPLRTGIAFGDCVIERERGLFAGQPIIDAYLTEEAQYWIRVTCDPVERQQLGAILARAQVVPSRWQATIGS